MFRVLPVKGQQSFLGFLVLGLKKRYLFKLVCEAENEVINAFARISGIKPGLGPGEVHALFGLDIHLLLEVLADGSGHAEPHRQQQHTPHHPLEGWLYTDEG